MVLHYYLIYIYLEETVIKQGCLRVGLMGARTLSYWHDMTCTANVSVEVQPGTLVGQTELSAVGLAIANETSIARKSKSESGFCVDGFPGFRVGYVTRRTATAPGSTHCN